MGRKQRMRRERSFCPNCGADADKEGLVDEKAFMVSVNVTACDGCGTRTSWYSDGTINVWTYKGRINQVPKGALLTDLGREM